MIIHEQDSGISAFACNAFIWIILYNDSDPQFISKLFERDTVALISVLEIPRGQPSEAHNFGGGPGTLCWFFFNFMLMIWYSRHEDLQLFWLSFKHWAFIISDVHFPPPLALQPGARATNVISIQHFQMHYIALKFMNFD